jgi:hypothetical protein
MTLRVPKLRPLCQYKIRRRRNLRPVFVGDGAKIDTKNFLLPVLFEVVLAFESSAAHLTAESQLGALVGPLVDHQVVGLGELPLAIFADEFVLGAHFSTELAPTNVVVNLYYRKHRV